VNTTDAQKSGQVQLAAFRVGDETYAVDIMRVREVIRAQPLTPVREGRHNVDGILSLRGLIVPVVDLRRCFHLPAHVSNHRRILVVVAKGRHLGLLVDSMTEVVRVLRSDLRAAPPMLRQEMAPFFAGACQARTTTLLLLNLNYLLEAPAVGP
jgi:purine-binding chemotaxis protein CheW